MIFQIMDWVNGLHLEVQPAGLPFLVLFRNAWIPRLVCGTMFGSSATLPILCSLQLRGLSLLSFGIFLGSAISFAMLYGEAIALHAHRTLVGAVVIITLILLSLRNSLEAFGPYIPLLVSLGLLITVHTMPRLQTYPQERNITTLDEYVMATSGPQPAGSRVAVANPTSTLSDEETQEDLSHGLTQDSLDFAHMLLNGEYQRTTRPDSPEHSSSLDLETGLNPQALSSTASAVTQDPFLPFQGGPVAFRA